MLLFERYEQYPLWLRAKLLAGPLFRGVKTLQRAIFSRPAHSTLLRVPDVHGPRTGELRASIIINNFNHARFLAEAVESALNQTHPNVEVIAVDDGSSDDSLNALEPFRDRITIIAKENRGQASCYSAGVSASSGDVVLFLDADDYLRPECIERALRHWSEDVSKLHFYLAVVDSDGNPIRATVPSGRLANEEALEMMRLFGSYCGPPASGNLFSAAFLRKILPLQNETKLTHSADSVPILSAPFFGRIVGVPETLGFYRRHAMANTGARIQFEAGCVLDLLQAEHRRDLLRDQSWRLTCRRYAVGPYHLFDPSRAKRRLCHLRLSGGVGLEKDDTRWSVLSLSIRAIWYWSGYTLLQKILATGWFILVAVLPMSLAANLIRVALAFGERKGWQHRLLAMRTCTLGFQRTRESKA